ncbi:hypothetical protein [Vibrio splendidus]|uniref:Transposase IS4-like domain-containing protein n=1 Tax=Vibrio splendidus TaxID=29497 RepID=A0ABV4M0B6_VIBSP|nr:hypothetical protein [Vibrio splendidus]
MLNEVQITNLYAKRMQIEEAFRHLKSAAYGIALRHNRTRCTKRLDILNESQYQWGKGSHTTQGWGNYEGIRQHRIKV